MTDETKKEWMPLLIVKVGNMSREDILRAKDEAGICILECEEPDAMRFMEPPSGHNVPDHARAALHLIRTIVGGSGVDTMWSRGNLSRWFADVLLNQPKVQPAKPVKR